MKKSENRTFYISIIAILVIVAALIFVAQVGHRVKTQEVPVYTDGVYAGNFDYSDPENPIELPPEPKADSVKTGNAINITTIKGNTYSFGGIESEGKIYINPHCDLATKEHKIGYIMRPNYGTITSDVPLTENAVLPEETTDVLFEWAYDKTASANYLSDTDKGICWSYTVLDGELPEEEYPYIYIHTYDMDKHNLLDVLKIRLEKNDSGAYSLAEVTEQDIEALELDVDRDELIALAKDALSSQALISTNEPFSSHTCVVERLERPFFPYYTNVDHQLAPSGNIKSDVYAVTLNSGSSAMGCFTFYFYADKDLVYAGMDCPYVFKSEDVPNIWQKR